MTSNYEGLDEMEKNEIIFYLGEMKVLISFDKNDISISQHYRKYKIFWSDDLGSYVKWNQLFWKSVGFQGSIKIWKIISCPCRIYKTFMVSVSCRAFWFLFSFKHFLQLLLCCNILGSKCLIILLKSYFWRFTSMVYYFCLCYMN